MNQIVKRTILITAIVIVALFLLLLFSPFLFKGKLMEIAKIELDKNLNARVDFRDLDLSFIRSFPDAHIALIGLDVVGVGDFEGEPIVTFDKLSVTVDIMSVVKMKNLQIESILLDKAKVNAHILPDKRANWDIVKSKASTFTDPEKPEIVVEPAQDTASAFSVSLKRFEIRDSAITYTDESSKMKASVGSLHYLLRGDMALEKVDLKMNLTAKALDLWIKGIRMLNQAEIGFTSEIDADLKNKDFILKDNRLNLNDIVIKLTGKAGLRENATNIDLTFDTDKANFKSLLSLVPAIYKNDFKSVQTSGNLTLKGRAYGSITQTTLPIVDVELQVNDAMFKYPELPKSVEKINIDLLAHYNGENPDKTTIDLKKFSFEMADNPFMVLLHIQTPISDMEINTIFNGKIDFNSLSEIIPLTDITLKGLLETSLTVAGKMSMIEKQQYESFAASGMIRLNDFIYTSSSFAFPVKIAKTELFFSPHRVELPTFEANIASTDISMNGSLENFIPYALKGDTVSASLTLRSSLVNLNEFMDKKEEIPETAETTKTQMSVIPIPKNINFLLNVNIDRILFDKLDIANTVGRLTVKYGILTMQNISMNLLEGSMMINGDYSTVDITKPFIDFSMNISRFDIPTTISSFDILSSFLSDPKDYTGKVSASMTLHSELDQHLSPTLDSIASRGQLQTYNIVIHNSELFKSVSEITKNDKWQTPALGSLEIHYVIRNGRLWLEKPIEMSLHPAKFTISGDQGLDMTMHYHVTASMPISEFGTGATGFLSSIPGGSNIKDISISGDISGTVKNPHVSLSMADMVSSVKEAVTDAVKEIVTEKVEEVKEQVNDEINKQLDAIMAEANEQATNVRNTAKQTADRIRREANEEADKVIHAAANKNIIERNAAKVVADKIRSEGEVAAKKAEQEGEVAAQNILSTAQRRCDELRRN